MAEADTNAMMKRPATETQPESGLDLRNILRLLWRQKLVIASSTLLLMAIAVAVVVNLKPEYTATASVVLDVQQERVVQFESVLAGLPLDPGTVQTEMQVLGSRSLAAQVIEALRLDQDPEFNESLRDPAEAPLPDRARAYVRRMIAAVAGPTETPAVADAGASPGLGRIIDSFTRHLKLSIVGESRAIVISFTAENPATAAAAANKLAELYVADELAAKRSATERANLWLSDQLVALRQKAEESRRATQAYRSEKGLLLGDRDTTLPTKEVSRLADELVKVKAERTVAEAQYMQAKAALDGDGGLESIPQVIDSGLIQSLRQQETVLSSKFAEMSQRLGKNHPDMAPVAVQLLDVRQSMGAEMSRILSGLEKQVSAARELERSLTDSLEGLKGDLGATNESEGELQVLEGEATVNQALFDSFLQRYKETATESSLHEAGTRIISRADVPANPSFPKKGMLLLLCLAAAGLVGITLAFVNESLDEGIRSMDQVEANLGLPALGLVPALGRGRWGRRAPARHVLKNRGSAFAESLRRLHSSLMLSGGAGPARTILLTSSLPHEGKTTIAVALGRLLATPQRKVIVVDADVRRPGVHRLVGLTPGPGLAECVAGTVKLEDAVRRDPESDLQILSAGSAGDEKARIAESDRMVAILSALARSHDVVIVDAAPVLAVNDARVIGRLVDRTVYLVRWGRTRRAVAAAGIKQLLDAGVPVAGALVTRVNVRRHALYGFGDSGSYYGQLARYYRG